MREPEGRPEGPSKLPTGEGEGCREGRRLVVEMGAVSGAEPGVREWRLGGSIWMGGEVLMSRPSIGCGGRGGAVREEDAAALLLPAAWAAAETEDDGAINGEERSETRETGRENCTDSDSLPPSVSTAPPKSKVSLSDGATVVRGTVLVRMYCSSLRSLLQNSGISRSMAQRVRPMQAISRGEAGRWGARAPEGCGRNWMHHTSSSAMS